MSMPGPYPYPGGWPPMPPPRREAPLKHALWWTLGFSALGVMALMTFAFFLVFLVALLIGFIVFAFGGSLTDLTGALSNLWDPVLAIGVTGAIVLAVMGALSVLALLGWRLIESFRMLHPAGQGGLSALTIYVAAGVLAAVGAG